MSDDVSQHHTLDSFAVSYSILNGKALLIILQSGEIIPPSSRSGSSFSSFSSTGLPQDKYRYLLHANQELERDNLVLKGQFHVLQ
jgi:hypothetical protein